MDPGKRTGRHPSNALTAAKVRTALGPAQYADGNGLYLQVDESGARRWFQRMTIRGKRQKIGLGGWPGVSLADAREAALENLRAVRRGEDPRLMRRRANMPTVAEAAATFIAMNVPTWDSAKTLYKWERSFRLYVNPAVGNLPISDVTTADVLAILTPVWTSKAETGRNVRQHLGKVMEWAIVQGYRPDNPAGSILNRVLPKMPAVNTHHPALPYVDVPAALVRIREADAEDVTKLSLEYLVLTASRSTEVRVAKWDEVNWDSATWTVPAERMKGRRGQRREHRVPLASRAVEVLEEARSLKGGRGLIFPSGKGKPISDNTHRKLMTVLGFRTADGRLAVPHGFRSSFKDWASEQTDAPDEVSEAALAHVRKNSTEAAYARSDLFDRRRVLMTQWAEFLGGECRYC